GESRGLPKDRWGAKDLDRDLGSHTRSIESARRPMFEHQQLGRGLSAPQEGLSRGVLPHGGTSKEPRPFFGRGSPEDRILQEQVVVRHRDPGPSWVPSKPRARRRSALARRILSSHTALWARVSDKPSSLR